MAVSPGYWTKYITAPGIRSNDWESDLNLLTVLNSHRKKKKKIIMPHCLLSATKNIYQSVTADEMQFCSFLCQLFEAIAGQVTKDISENLGLFLVVWCFSSWKLYANCFCTLETLKWYVLEVFWLSFCGISTWDKCKMNPHKNTSLKYSRSTNRS